MACSLALQSGRLAVLCHCAVSAAVPNISADPPLAWSAAISVSARGGLGVVDTGGGSDVAMGCGLDGPGPGAARRPLNHMIGTAASLPYNRIKGHAVH
jgi:hypothetical protein